MRMICALVIAAVFAIVVAPSSAEEQTESPYRNWQISPLDQPPTGAVVLVGSLVANRKFSFFNPSEYCLEDEKMLYKGFDFRLHKTNLVFSGEISEESYEAPLVILEGEYVKDLTTKIEKIDTCDPETYAPPMQQRSDWESPECGSRVGISSRARLARLYYFDTDKDPQSSTFITFKQAKANLLEITMHNTFEVTIPQFEVQSHYEGGMGKPEPEYERYMVPALKPGDAHTLTLKVDLETDEDTLNLDNKRSMQLSDISFYIQVDQLIFDAMIPVTKMGIEWD